MSPTTLRSRARLRALARLGVIAPTLAIGIACSAFRRGSSEPRIESVHPDSVVMASGAVVEVLVKGGGFERGTPGRNTILFGEVTIPDVPANEDGTEIRFVIPDRVPGRGEAAPLPLEAGTYRLRVQTTAGVSNHVMVRVDR